jgi:hypothetical protein
MDETLELQCRGALVTFDADKDENQWAFILSSEENSERESGESFVLNILH